MTKVAYTALLHVRKVLIANNVPQEYDTKD
jgi:hypothetical protein